MVRSVPTMMMQTSMSNATQPMMTGFGPTRESSLPASQQASAPTAAAVMPNTPICTTDQPSTPAA